MRSPIAGAALAFVVIASTNASAQPAETTTPTPTPTPTAAGATTGESGATVEDRGGIKEAPPAAAQSTPTETPDGKPIDLMSRLKPELFGYVKLGYTYTMGPAGDSIIGQNNGFRLSSARVGLSLHPAKKLEAVISVDASAPQRRDQDPLEGNRVVALRDGYIEYKAMRFLKIRGGQFKAPFNAETLLPDDALPFVSRSVVSEGILPPETNAAREGLSLDRQVGIQLASERLGGDVGFQYALAVVNGNGINVLNNDNNSVTPVARVAVGFKELVSVGANAYYNSATFGDRPGRINETRLGYGGDVSVNVAGLNVFGMVLLQNVRHEDVGVPDEQALGIVGSARYLFEPLGLEAGVRYARYEPSNAQTNDQLQDVAAMVGYRVKGSPARILVQYTLRIEEANASVANDSVDALAQITF